MSDERLGELGPMVERAAAEITEKAGGRAPAARRSDARDGG
jgi:hypothetical protein